jgi:PST family polysaccharide transporter
LYPLFIRKKIIVSLGIEQAGYWEAMGRISSYYLLFVSSILGLYFLPKLSVAKNNNDTKQLFREYYKTIVPLFILGMLGLYFFRDFIIQILFTKAFSPVATLFFWQLIGDSLKVASLILGYEFFAKKLTKAFIFFELLSLSILYISSLFFVSKYGIKGIVMAHSLTYFIYFVCLALFFRKKLF